MSQVNGETVRDRVTVRKRMTVQEAAYRLGVKDDAIRKRIQRGTLDHEKDKDGRVYVFIDATHDMSQSASQDNTRHTTQNLYQDSVTDTSQDTLVATLQDQLQYLRDVIETRDRELEARTDELRRKDTIIMSLAQRVPELTSTSPPEDPGSHDGLFHSPEGDQYQKTAEDHQVALKRPWWRRIFGG